jgi:hypothetical protein
VKQRRIDITPESDMVEWKQSLGEWKEIVETCAAFATARGVFLKVLPGEKIRIQWHFLL